MVVKPEDRIASETPHPDRPMGPYTFVSTRQFDHLPPAGEIGRACAIASRVQRDLHVCAQRYIALFPPELFGGTVLSAIALANTFASPWLTADRLRPVNRAALWTFGLDR